MDFWSRLLSPLSTSNARAAQLNDQAQRLQRFEREYDNLLAAWRKSSTLSSENDAAELIELRLQELTDILNEEGRRPLPHPCIQHAAHEQIYVPVSKIASTSQSEWVVKEAIAFFATLVDSEEEAFVRDGTFSTSLTNLLVRVTSVEGVRLGLDTEARVVELAFSVTTKLRLDPAILPAWFHAQQHKPQPEASEESRSREGFTGRTQKADFPLFYVLLDYIHHEGKVGDFGRTGLLYIIEAASSSVELEQWIVESDLSTLMATGLGALYSQLSRKLVIDHPPDELPPILALSDYEHPICTSEIVSSCSSESQLNLKTFLSHLLFWQDVLNHCKYLEIKQTLLEHLQVIFLQQLLYPSLLESSDLDGGSSVAVLTYLRRVDDLEHPDMVHLVLHYLLALPDFSPAVEDPRSPITDARRRKSRDLATMMAHRSGKPVGPLLFNLLDMIMACLKSRNHQTIQVTLQLLSTIMKNHHRYATITLVQTEAFQQESAGRTFGAHEQEIEFLICLASSIGGSSNFNEIYKGALRDAQFRLETHACSLPKLVPDILLAKEQLVDDRVSGGRARSCSRALPAR